VAVIEDGWDHAPMRREQVSNDAGPILQEEVAGQCLEQKDSADHSTAYKSYLAQWKSPAVTDGTLKWHWELTKRSI
jgi:hypothetical protein